MGLHCTAATHAFNPSHSKLNESEKKDSVLRKHSLHGKNSSLGFIVAVYQWKYAKSLTPPIA